MNHLLKTIYIILIHLRYAFNLNTFYFFMLQFDLASWDNANMMTNISEKPCVLSYDNYRSYLKNWYEWMKATKHGFSYRAFSRWANFSSPNHLQLIIQGKRNITSSTIEIFTKLLKLNRRETKYFELLVRLNQAASPEEKGKTLQEMSIFYKKFKNNLPHTQIEYLSKWFYSVLRELLTVKGVRFERHFLAKKIGRGVTPRQIDEAIDKLLEIGLISKGPDGKFKQNDVTLTTGPETQEAAAYLYHNQMLFLAIEALKKQKPTERNFSGITLACSKADIPEISEIITDCRHRILGYLEDKCKKENEDVYQLNIQLFRLTQNGGDSK